MEHLLHILNASIINIILVVVVVVLHNTALVRLSSLLRRMRQSHHFRLIVGVLGVLATHTLQVWIFATAYYLMLQSEGWGTFTGNTTGSFLDCVYSSFTTFTTLGYGDIEAVGVVRFLTGIEALTGLVLITWSASFLYVEMQRYWPSR